MDSGDIARHTHCGNQVAAFRISFSAPARNTREQLITQPASVASAEAYVTLQRAHSSTELLHSRYRDLVKVQHADTVAQTP